MALKFLTKYQIELRKMDKKDVKVIIEQVSAMPGQGVTSMFNFGQSFGILKGNMFSNAIANVLCETCKMEKIF
jgi:crossover junction endodeoxyribonuclease RuvC